MKNLLIGLFTVSTLFSSVSHSADDLSEKDIQGISKAAKEYAISLYSSMNGLCLNKKKVADARVDLDLWPQDDEDTSFNFLVSGHLTYRCEDSIEWQEGESCQFVKDSKGKWEVDYCDH